MGVGHPVGAAMWAVARFEPGRDRLGLASLERGGFAPYYPRIREHRVRHGRKIVATPGLFSGYCFLVIRHQWYEARWSPGILGLIMDGIGPAKVSDAVIAEIRSRERDGLIDLPAAASHLAPGDPVRITCGALAGLTGLVAGMKPRERVAVLLAMLGRVTLPTGSVELVKR
jgi:transcription antitermination factor NusG